MKFGIYIHWGFCLSKCPYCDFFSEVRKDIPQEQIIDEYLADLDFYHAMTSEKTVTSIFFGGGTPSLIKPQNIERIINHIQSKWKCAENVEISLEANPNTNHPNMFKDLRVAGINRLSLGIQALNDADLKFLGRTHNTKEALKAIDGVLNTFDNHSMDMIYALPHQGEINWKEVTDFGFKHLSLYQLTIEEGTPFHKRGIKPLDEEKAAEIYQSTSAFLEGVGYNRYEVSNFAKAGYECRHNLTYWEGYDYLGIGKGAHGRIGLKATTHRRQIEELTPTERAEELLIMGLRLKNGIDKQRFSEQCGLAFNKGVDLKEVENLVAQGLLFDSDNNIRVTDTGSLFINYIIGKISK